MKKFTVTAMTDAKSITRTFTAASSEDAAFRFGYALGSVADDSAKLISVIDATEASEVSSPGGLTD